MTRRVSALALFAALFPFLTAFDPIRSPSGSVTAGNAAMTAGKPNDALSAYDKAVAELPAEPGVHFDRGTALAALSRFDEAGEEFLRATEAKDPTLKAAAFYNLGNAFMKKDKFKEAIEAYKRTLALAPTDERAKWNLEIALKKKRDDDKKKEDQKNKDDKDKKKDDQKKDDKDKQDQKDDKKKDDQKKDDQKKDDKKKDDQKDKPDQPKPKDGDNKDKSAPPPEEKPAAEREIESTLDNLEKSPKDLEKQRAMMRAVRRAPPTRDW